MQLVNFRSGLILRLVESGYDVIVVSLADEYKTLLKLLGCRYTPLVMDNKVTHSVRDFQHVLCYLKLFLRKRLFGICLKQFSKYVVADSIRNTAAAPCKSPKSGSPLGSAG